MKNTEKITPPFFEIGPKSYIYGQELIDLALIAEEASNVYDVDIIFTVPFLKIEHIASLTTRLKICAPHMDAIVPGRGLADILPEMLVNVGADGVMLNHIEKPLRYIDISKTIMRAKEVGLFTIVCSDSIAEAKAIALLKPDIIVTEPSELIGTGKTSSMDYVNDSIQAVKSINPAISVLQGAGISCGKDVYRVIRAGAEATGSSSGIVKAANRKDMVFEMISAARQAWDDREDKR